MRFFYTTLVFFLLVQVSLAQDKGEKEKLSMKVFKDSLDGKLDMSDFLINYHGFIPLANIITEPALGGIGVMFTPIFIKPNKNQDLGEFIPPDITAAFVGYTGNKSWGAGALRIASFPKQHLKYRVGAAYGDVNMDFFRTFPVVGEQKFAFNFNTTAAFGSLLRQIGKSQLFLGLEYLYLHNKVMPDFGVGELPLPDFVDEKSLDNNLSSVGLVLEFDKRDNVFTPDKGWYVTSDFRINDSWTGSDYTYQNWNIAALKYFQFAPKWVSGFRAEGRLQFNDAPFYLKPGIALRGVPMARYQGDQTYVMETEQRYDFTDRWSALAFVGAGKAVTKQVSFSDANLVYNYGTGFRYLIARKFGVRTGIDVAWSNEDFGWYIVFGSAWNNRN
ncbi:glyceraldehyde-3-phosphate dehydrogenase [Algoriphagus sp. NG3]|uniref:glyceraldehyde-3-phosphate dehydrogenase n=1 Tax=Algoriphagus sp. NG3 TaxID=3097546 RepID=UPI002A7F994F|nr:glyceraldehyde-3-phosphate dehydrogenase [Algoriphagus sp. NG3]WPR75240.1 glyceraldehyde-3-phosphate dehydrogenase [Algoriphagus sp. NG3]